MVLVDRLSVIPFQPVRVYLLYLCNLYVYICYTSATCTCIFVIPLQPVRVYLLYLCNLYVYICYTSATCTCIFVIPLQPVRVYLLYLCNLYVYICYTSAYLYVYICYTSATCTCIFVIPLHICTCIFVIPLQPVRVYLLYLCIYVYSTHGSIILVILFRLYPGSLSGRIAVYGDSNCVDGSHMQKGTLT